MILTSKTIFPYEIGQFVSRTIIFMWKLVSIDVKIIMQNFEEGKFTFILSEEQSLALVIIFSPIISLANISSRKGRNIFIRMMKIKKFCWTACFQVKYNFNTDLYYACCITIHRDATLTYIIISFYKKYPLG